VKTVIAIVLLLALGGCKQGRGERCQVDSDCAEGNCSQAEPKVCGGDSTGVGLDAEIPPQIDAPTPIDAAVDSRIDAR